MKRDMPLVRTQPRFETESDQIIPVVARVPAGLRKSGKQRYIYNLVGPDHVPETPEPDPVDVNKQFGLARILNDFLHPPRS